VLSARWPIVRGVSEGADGKEVVSMVKPIIEKIVEKQQMKKSWWRVDE
jgi:hypothetical protein